MVQTTGMDMAAEVAADRGAVAASAMASAVVMVSAADGAVPRMVDRPGKHLSSGPSGLRRSWRT